MNRLKYIILFVILLVSYLIYPTFIVLLLQLFKVPYNDFSAFGKEILGIGIYLSYIIIMFLVYRKTLVKELKEFFTIMKTDFFKCFKTWIFGVIIMIISNTIILQIYPTNASNEIAVQQSFISQPLYVFIISVFIAPFIEEMIFRKGMRKIFASPYTYIIASGVLFGYIHTLANPTNMMELLYIIPYGAMGACFAYLYQKYENIFVTVLFHMLHNLISLSITFLVYFGL